MEASTAFCAELEDILFRYECVTALVNMLYSLVSDGPVEVLGVEENTVEFSLYEISEKMKENNRSLHEFVRDGRTIEDKKAAE